MLATELQDKIEIEMEKVHMRPEGVCEGNEENWVVNYVGSTSSVCFRAGVKAEALCILTTWASAPALLSFYTQLFCLTVPRWAVALCVSVVQHSHQCYPRKIFMGVPSENLRVATSAASRLAIYWFPVCLWARRWREYSSSRETAWEIRFKVFEASF